MNKPDGLTPHETKLGKPRAKWSKAEWSAVAMQLAGAGADDDLAAYMADDGPGEYDAGICPACSGSGEGEFDGSVCTTCRGRGEA